MGNPLLSWFRSFSDRKQFVQIHNTHSNLTSVTSGPRGLLQDKLNKFSDWVARLGISLNLSKCQIITFSRFRTPILNNYHINGAPLHRVFSIKDLGIHYSSLLCFSRHIGITVGRALKVIGFIKRSTKHFSSANCLWSLYISLVRSLLEYGAVIWNPYLTRDQLRIERVQNKFLAYAAFILKLPDPCHDYTYSREVLSLPTLDSRRSLADQNFIMALLNGLLDAPDILSNISFKVPSHNTRNQEQFYIPVHSTTYGHNNPIHRMLRSFQF
ncbi:hypothetical protein AGLY_002699 [Aphis glycines]|uniref:Reverse transcriptase domain-containing protein n=1 Tax=Aphis glycines TaxID=307491 RepID=A0A6G0U0Z6_APHGL|nr:hypothetical protein AGLY_002699 [Aphis glycines]